jgi:mono/diheme cytochrome c family protein
MWAKWQAANQHVVAFDGPVPPPTAESIARGRELYLDGQSANCVSCHGPQGRGDGVSAFARDPVSGELVASANDEWGNPDVPRNLTLGVFRGGRRPIDIYRRIYAGINGSKMPGIGDSKKPDGSPLLSQEDLWALVHYVGSLSEQPYAPISHHEPAAPSAAVGDSDPNHH